MNDGPQTDHAGLAARIAPVGRRLLRRHARLMRASGQRLGAAVAARHEPPEPAKAARRLAPVRLVTRSSAPATPASPAPAPVSAWDASPTESTILPGVSDWGAEYLFGDAGAAVSTGQGWLGGAGLEPRTPEERTLSRLKRGAPELARAAKILEGDETPPAATPGPKRLARHPAPPAATPAAPAAGSSPPAATPAAPAADASPPAATPAAPAADAPPRRAARATDASPPAIARAGAAADTGSATRATTAAGPAEPPPPAATPTDESPPPAALSRPSVARAADAPPVAPARPVVTRAASSRPGEPRVASTPSAEVTSVARPGAARVSTPSAGAPAPARPVVARAGSTPAAASGARPIVAGDGGMPPAGHGRGGEVADAPAPARAVARPVVQRVARPDVPVQPAPTPRPSLLRRIVDGLRGPTTTPSRPRVEAPTPASPPRATVTRHAAPPERPRLGLQAAEPQEPVSETPALTGTRPERLARMLGTDVQVDAAGNQVVEMPFVPFDTTPRTVSRATAPEPAAPAAVTSDAPAAGAAPTPPAPAVDVEQLTETVIETIRRELVIEREQAGGPMDLL